MPLEETEWTRRYGDTLRARGCAARTTASYLYALTGFARFVAPQSMTDTTVDDTVAYQMNIVAASRAAAAVSERCPACGEGRLVVVAKWRPAGGGFEVVEVLPPPRAL